MTTTTPALLVVCSLGKCLRRVNQVLSNSFSVVICSAGLVFLHYGSRIIRSPIQPSSTTPHSSIVFSHLPSVQCQASHPMTSTCQWCSTGDSLALLPMLLLLLLASPTARHPHMFCGVAGCTKSSWRRSTPSTTVSLLTMQVTPCFSSFNALFWVVKSGHQESNPSMTWEAASAIGVLLI